eukprot:7214484-Ditylum_brightwellii.AAC.1
MGGAGQTVIGTSYCSTTCTISPLSNSVAFWDVKLEIMDRNFGEEDDTKEVRGIFQVRRGM